VTAVEIRCEGAPRDLGLDQGRECRSALRARFERRPWWQRWLCRLGLDGKRSARLARDLARHFPQQSETLEGMVRGAGVPYGWFAESLAREFAAERPEPSGGTAALAAGPALTTTGCLIARTLASEPVVRRSAPEGGFASVDLTLPWLTAALAGVNEDGLAVAAVSLAGAGAGDSCSVPAALLVQDCLARFDSIGGAVDWCTSRPVGGRAAILLADAQGELALVALAGDDRRVVPPEAGLVCEGVGLAAAAALRADAPLDLSAAAKILGARVAGIDPAGRRVALVDAVGKSEDWYGVEQAV
jgi:hypothetical protein